MKILWLGLVLASSLIVACSNDDDSSVNLYTGREVVYTLDQASDFPVSGTVTFRELKTSVLEATIELKGTSGEALHPAHLHFGDISTPDAPMALALTDVAAATGKSVTSITQLMDETSFGYDDLLVFEGSVKVHLAADGDGKKVVLAGGNVGKSATPANSNGRRAIAVCSSK